MLTFDQLQQRFNEALDLDQLPSYPARLYAPIRYSLSHGGKRMRPLLVLMSCDLFSGDIDDAMNCAIAVEIFHNFTLLHDDIMDQSPIRRGIDTVYKKWNTSIAILSGDTMFALAYDYITRSRPVMLPLILPLFTQTAREVCEGQQLDMDFEESDTVSIADYIEMIRLKTAVLPAACLKLGALFAGVSQKEAELIYSFGQHIGLAFQLKDDLLDIYGDQVVFGKRTGNDILTNKKTWLYLKALEKADPEQKKQLLYYYSGKSFDPMEKISKVTGIYNQLKINEAAEALMLEYYDKAMQDLDTINVPDANKEIVRDFAMLLKERSL
ncbi:MAG: polyprenyl synthetase family protein [Bacteroidetes bacterium]|nr:polyprenyl synthetase family protein [Bacteroidota bacterium]